MGLLYNLLFCRKILLCSLGLNIMLDLCILKTTGTFTFISNCNVSTKFFVCQKKFVTTLSQMMACLSCGGYHSFATLFEMEG